MNMTMSTIKIVRNLAINNILTQNLETTIAMLHTHINGLTDEESKQRIIQYGKNNVITEQTTSAILQLLQAFNNPFIWVLNILVIVGFITDYCIPIYYDKQTDLTSVSIMFFMVMLSGLLRFCQEYRTNKAAKMLKSLIKNTAIVIRRTHSFAKPVKKEILLENIVPGDIIFLSAGDIVPADVRLLDSKDLFINQATFNGESLPVKKYNTMNHHNPKINHKIKKNEDLLNQTEICLMGTNVTSGTATAVVVATGINTWFGSLAKTIIGKRPKTAFDYGVTNVSWLLIYFMLIMVPIVLFLNGFFKGNWIDALLFALAVAVGLTPEMLPMIVSSNLAKGATAMSRQKVVIKNLNAIQNLGAMDILCTDKTGTLTCDEIILEEYLNIYGYNDEKVLQLAWLNSFYQSGIKNLMDQAIIKFCNNNSIIFNFNSYSKLDELPFDFERRRLSILVMDEKQQQILICKGAVDEMLSIAKYWMDGNQIKILDKKSYNKWYNQVKNYNEKGFRVLLIGKRLLIDKPLTIPLCEDDERDLIIFGLLTFLDPPKESASEAINALQNNGVKIKILTGDNLIITDKICRDVCLDPGIPLCGNDLNHLNDNELDRIVENTTIFYRLTPQQKSRVVQALQRNTHTVGFLGDGINDAPALHTADIGISVDNATNIAKESADMILLEKNLLILESGIIKGRETFGNIIKYLNMTASSNFGNVFSILIASIFLPFLPMLAIHLLIQNLIYDISQLALPWDKTDQEFLQYPRKWDAKNIKRFMLILGPISSIFDIITFLLMWYVFGANNVEHQALFQSGWFIESLLSQILVIHMLRTQKIPFIQRRAALPVMIMTILVMIIGIYIPYSPLGSAVGLVPLPWQYFYWLIIILLGYCMLVQIIKKIYIRLFGHWF